MFCLQCGRELPNGANVCPYCGRMVDREKPDVPGYDDFPTGRPAGMAKRKDTKKIVALSIAILILLGVISWSVWFLMKDRSYPDNYTADSPENQLKTDSTIDAILSQKTNTSETGTEETDIAGTEAKDSASAKETDTAGTAEMDSASAKETDTARTETADTSETLVYQREFLTDAEKSSAQEQLREYLQIEETGALFVCGAFTGGPDTYTVSGVTGKQENEGIQNIGAEKFTAQFLLDAKDENNGKVTLQNVERKAFVRGDFHFASASSVCPSAFGYTYGPEHVMDDDDDTVWAEGADGYGINESITISASAEKEVYGFAISNAILADNRALVRNAQMKRVRISFSDGSSREMELSRVNSLDHGYSTILVFDSPVTTSLVSFTILDVYEGSDYVDPDDHSLSEKCEDTCVNEILILE